MTIIHRNKPQFQQPPPEFFVHMGRLNRGGRFNYFCRPVEGDAARRFSSAWYKVGANYPPVGADWKACYYGVNPSAVLREEFQRSKTIHIAAMNAVVADFDAKMYPDGLADCWRLLGDFAPATPSFLTFTGGGLHAVFYLDKPFMVTNDDERERAKRLQKKFVEHCQADDGAKTLTQVLRIAGTLNKKYTPPLEVEILEFNPGTSYTFEELEAHCHANDAPLFTPDEDTPLSDGYTVGTSPRTSNRLVLTNYIDAVFRGECERLRIQPVGGRHAQLNKSAYLLATFIKHGLTNEQEIERALIPIARSLRMDTPQELERIVRVAIAAGRQEVRDLKVVAEKHEKHWQSTKTARAVLA